MTTEPMITPLEWWSGLCASTQNALIADADGCVPPANLVEVVQAAGYPIATQWPGAEMTPHGLGLPPDFRDLVAARRTSIPST